MSGPRKRFAFFLAKVFVFRHFDLGSDCIYILGSFHVCEILRFVVAIQRLCCSFHAGMQCHGICQTWEGMLGLWGRQVNSMQADWGTDRFRRLAEQFLIFHLTLSFSMFFIIFGEMLELLKKSFDFSFPTILVFQCCFRARLDWVVF